MILSKRLHFEGSKGSAELEALFDSGATYSFLQLDLASQLGPLDKLPRPLAAETASAGTFLKIEHRILLDFYLNDLRLTDEFLVIANLSEQAIIGATTMQKWRIKLDFEHEQIITDPRAAKVILKAFTKPENGLIGTSALLTIERRNTSTF